MTPEFMGFGNQLYLWAWAHANSLETVPRRVLIVERSRYWLPYSPLGRPQLLEKSEMAFGDSRDHFYAYSAYAFDVEAYVRQVVPRAIEQDGPVKRIHVVSDDPVWCRAHLGWLSAYADEVTEPPREAEPIHHMRDVVLSRRLVIANGTFSFWAAAISRILLDAPQAASGRRHLSAPLGPRPMRGVRPGLELRRRATRRLAASVGRGWTRS